MLIQDGRRLIFVTEDPEMQKKLIELDKSCGGSIANMPLIPIPVETQSKSSVPFDESEYNKYLNSLMNVNDMTAIMREYEKISEEASSETRIKKVKGLKKAIWFYLSWLDGIDVIPNRKKLLEMNKQIPQFIKPSIAYLISNRGYKSLEDFCKCADPREVDGAYNNLIEHSMKRCST